MSELKEYLFCECDTYIREYKGPLSNEIRPFYLKSEADKVIAHHKYKRCVAMAEWCGEKWADIATPYGKSVWYNKWQKRWLSLANKFKEKK